MITLTKEWLLKTIAELEEDRDAVPGTVNEDAAMALAAMKLALASLDAEPVGFIARHKETGKFGSYLHPKADWFKNDDYEVLSAYTAPPAPVSVPDAMTPKQASRAYCGEVRGYRDGWNACRAAMLQGAERVSNRDELPDGWMACSERMPEQYDYEIWTYSPTKGVNHSLGYDGHARTFSDVDYYSTIDDVTHWMPITRPAAPRQETK